MVRLQRAKRAATVALASVPVDSESGTGEEALRALERLVAKLSQIPAAARPGGGMTERPHQSKRTARGRGATQGERTARGRGATERRRRRRTSKGGDRLELDFSGLTLENAEGSATKISLWQPSRKLRLKRKDIVLVARQRPHDGNGEGEDESTHNKEMLMDEAHVDDAWVSAADPVPDVDEIRRGRIAMLAMLGVAAQHGMSAREFLEGATSSQ